ncbi:MAG: YfcE family phosphodiesterase [Acidobacteriota bacterium]
MRIAILSDIHDNIWNLAAALEKAAQADALVCLGDLCSPFVVHQFGLGFAGPVHILFGNNDGDLYRIAANARAYPHVEIHAEFYRAELGGKRIAAVHYDNIGRPLAASGEFDVVAFGHNHVHELRREGRTLVVNPGPIMGAKFAADGTAIDVPSTFVLYDTVSDTAETLTVPEPARRPG